MGFLSAVALQAAVLCLVAGLNPTSVLDSVLLDRPYVLWLFDAAGYNATQGVTSLAFTEPTRSVLDNGRREFPSFVTPLAFVGDPVLVAVGPTFTGLSEDALELNGVDQHGVVAFPAARDVTPHTGTSFTLEAWLVLRGFYDLDADTQTIVSSLYTCEGFCGQHGLELVVSRSQRVTFTVHTGDGECSVTSPRVPLVEFLHIVAVYDNDTPGLELFASDRTTGTRTSVASTPCTSTYSANSVTEFRVGGGHSPVHDNVSPMVNPLHADVVGLALYNRKLQLDKLGRLAVFDATPAVA